MRLHRHLRLLVCSFVLGHSTLVIPPLAAAPTPEQERLARLSLADAAAEIRSGKTTATQITEAVLARIEVYNPKLDAFITVMKEQALAQAKVLDAEAKAGKFRGPLHGVPIALKDNVDTAGVRTTGGSAAFADRIPAEDAPIVTRMVAAGAVIIGKTDLQEFAMGGGESSYYGPARNPWNLAHNTGGSSSGSGAAVSAFLAHGAIGTDTGGSIRMPASFSGIVGHKPTYGLVPIRGIIPLRVTMDHAGPMTRTVKDAALMLNVLAGYDKLDITSAEAAPKVDYVAALDQPVKGLRLGLPVGFYDHLDPEVEAAFKEALVVLNRLTAGAREMSLPPSPRPINGHAETLAWHAPHEAVFSLYQIPQRRRVEAWMKDGAGKASDYVRDLWQVQLARRTIDDAFEAAGVDLVVTTTHRILPPKLDDLLARAYSTNPSDPRVTSNCWPFNYFGLPSISIPCGFSKDGLPIGLMISGPRFSDARVLALAHAYEQATQWHTKQPPLNPETTKPEINKPR